MERCGAAWVYTCTGATQKNAVLSAALGHCYLMMDDLQQAYSAYQQALYHLPDPKVGTPAPASIDCY